MLIFIEEKVIIGKEEKKIQEEKLRASAYYSQTTATATIPGSTLVERVYYLSNSIYNNNNKTGYLALCRAS